jgi:hypothetical protein
MLHIVTELPCETIARLISVESHCCRCIEYLDLRGLPSESPLQRGLFVVEEEPHRSEPVHYRRRQRLAKLGAIRCRELPAKRQRDGDELM